MKPISRTSPAQFRHAREDAFPTWANSFAQSIREVSREPSFSAVLSALPALFPDCRDCRSSWPSRLAATGDSVQTPRDSDTVAFRGVGSASPVGPKTQTGSSRQHHSSQAALTSVHGPAPHSRSACAGAGHSKPAHAGRLCLAPPTVAPAQTPAGHSSATGVQGSEITPTHRGQTERYEHFHRPRTRCASRQACWSPPHAVRDRELDCELNQDLDILLHTIFKDRPSHDAYQTAERHLQFIEVNKENWAEVCVFDSRIQQAYSP